MPKIFGLFLFSSFHHQLNCYGFIKLDTNEYYNEKFSKNKKNLLNEIKRKKTKRIKFDKEIYDKIEYIQSRIKVMNTNVINLENKLNILQNNKEKIIKDNIFLKNKLIEVQTKQQDLGYIFFIVVENLFPELALIKKQCLYFINSNTYKLPNFENQKLNFNNILKESSSLYKIDSGNSSCKTKDTKTKEEYDYFIDVE